MELPQRRRLPHAVPLWVDPNREVYFLTLCCRPRGLNQLADEPTAKALFETVAFRVEQGLWWPYLVLLMPDHLHMLVSFPPSGRPVKRVVSQWKEWTAKRLGIEWQTDFFEHRVRREESLRDKSDYILANPVRANLVDCPKAWPYAWFATGCPPHFDR
jgi:REP element-mobilizing transposase RayT